MQRILFIDGRNFLRKIGNSLNSSKSNNPEGDFEIDHAKINFKKFNFSKLINKVLAGIAIDRKIFYMGKLIVHQETTKQSKVLIERQRVLKTHLENQGFEVIITGRVRGHIEKCPKGHETLTFKEKGVDVKIAVDMITMARDNKLKLAIIGSSDSDLQPVIKELKNQNIERIYLGFESQPNKGLSYTTNRTILIRNSEILECLEF